MLDFKVSCSSIWVDDCYKNLAMIQVSKLLSLYTQKKKNNNNNSYLPLLYAKRYTNESLLMTISQSFHTTL